MKKFMYMPGCSLKNYATNYEKSAIGIAKKLGIELVELERWNCCGVVYGLASDSVFHQIAAVRNLIRAQETSKNLGNNKLVTLCSMCYQVLASANHRIKNDEQALEALNKFMDEEEDYRGEIEVKHFLAILRDEIGFDKIKEKIVRPLKNLNIAPYYGCVLVRPKEAAIDDPEDPIILETLIETIGGNPIYWPFRTDCCGSYNVVSNQDIVKKRVWNLIKPIRDEVDIIITVCPLCKFNLDLGIDFAKKEYYIKNIPVLYFTEILAYALGLDEYLDSSIINLLENMIKKEEVKTHVP